MNVSSEKKLKQAKLDFKTTSSKDKKRKLADDTNLEDVKCRRISHDKESSADSNLKSSNDDESLTSGKHGDSSIVNPIEVMDCADFSENESVNGIKLSNIENDETNDTPEKQKTLQLPVCEENVRIALGDPSKNDAENTVPKKTTPKLSKEQAQLRKEERERLKQEKDRQKHEKEQKRLAKLELKNEEKRKKEEERRTKEEEKRQKEEERRAKEEEKRQKEEDKRQKEEEKRLRDEERRQKEELEKKKKEKTAAIFANFFLKNKTTPSKTQVTETLEKSTTTKFMPFEVKENMRLANILRVPVTPEKMRCLDEILSSNVNMEVDSLYLARLRSKDNVPGRSENIWPNANDEDNDDTKHETEAIHRYRCKLLQFKENRRPAYWGTWRKRSKKINGRRPFVMDPDYFEYDVDSDDEWVEEEPGESLDGSDDDQESEDDYEVDNDLFVPHGYLSDGEGQPDEVMTGSPKSQKQKLNILEKQFEDEMKEKTSKLKSRVYGCIWISNKVEKNGKDEIENLLLSFRAVWNQERAPFRIKNETECATPTITPSSKSKITPQSLPKGVLTEFPESLLVNLIKLAHGNKLRGQKLVDEFKLYAMSVDPSFNLTKACVLTKLREIASWIPNLACWLVNEDVRQQHNFSELLHTENTWNYLSNIETTTTKKCQNEFAEKSSSAFPPATVTTPTSSGNSRKTSNITNFIRVYRASEKEKKSPKPTIAAETEIDAVQIP